jgi:2-C-methyl-D-erythritol 2,4-cyclodiphosphate synthase/2-C-methyl-D-erythritol 4-phosphate cytidylyltransferase
MYKGKTVAALIAAGGLGTRFGAGVPKQFMEINGRSMLACSVAPFLRSPFVDETIVLAPAGFEREAGELLAREFGAGFFCRTDAFAGTGADASAEGTSAGGRLRVVLGGADRQASVRRGLEAANCRSGLVLIHDAARPFVTEDLVNRVLDAAFRHGAAVPGIPVKDTIYEVEKLSGKFHAGFFSTVPAAVPGIPAADRAASRALDRGRLVAAQTPQGFDFSLIEEAHRFASENGVSVTDDGMPTMAHGHSVHIVEGDPANIKITAPEDMAAFSSGSCRKTALLASGQYRVGIGFDAHAFCQPGCASGQTARPLVLGGVAIPFGRGLEGHSDADVLTHALMDAILGALHAGDIGLLFPDTDAAYRGISSLRLLKQVARLMSDRRFALVNADMTIVAERPQMAPHRDAVESSLAAALGAAPGCVSVKATTTEKLGFTGREEGIAAEAVVLLKEIAEQE